MVAAAVASGFTDPSREGAADPVNDDAPFPFFPSPLPPSGGADNEVLDESRFLGRGAEPLFAFSLSFAATDAAYSESLSPTHERTNQRPPAIPRISRWAVRQCLIFFPFLSNGIGGAKPVGILSGGWTGKGLEGRG